MLGTKLKKTVKIWDKKLEVGRYRHLLKIKWIGNCFTLFKRENIIQKVSKMDEKIKSENIFTLIELKKSTLTPDLCKSLHTQRSLQLGKDLHIIFNSNGFGLLYNFEMDIWLWHCSTFQHGQTIHTCSMDLIEIQQEFKLKHLSYWYWYWYWARNQHAQ